MVRRTLLVVLAIVLSLGACARKEEARVAPASAPPLPDDVKKVESVASTSVAAPGSPAAGGSTPGLVADTPMGTGSRIDATGEFVSPVRSELAARLPGRVARIFVDEGTRVTRGQPVLELETEYVKLNLARAGADAQRARAAETEARRDLARKKELIGKSSIPQALFDRSEGTYEQARAARQSADSQVALYRQQLSDSVLRSPINGVVAEKRTDVGQRLGDNTVAMVLVQTSPLKLRFRVPERYLAAVHRGQTVTARVDPYPEERFTGLVTVVGGVIDPATRSMLVETEFPNRDGKLRPGLFARVEMQPGS